MARIHRRTIQKGLTDLDNHNAVVSHLEPDSLECKIQWTSGSIITNKARYDGIPAELFKILRDDVVQVLHSLCQQIWKIQQWPQDWKRSDFIPIPRRAMPDNFPTTVQLHSLHMLTRICSKCFKIGFSSI